MWTLNNKLCIKRNFTFERSPLKMTFLAGKKRVMWNKIHHFKIVVITTRINVSHSKSWMLQQQCEC